MKPRPNWFRAPPWTGCPVDEVKAEKAKAWLYLLSAWHNGDDPTVRELRRVTGFGGGRADKEYAECVQWAIDNEAAVPDRVAGQNRGSSGAEPGHLDAGAIGKIAAHRGKSGAEAGQERGASRARDPLSGERERKREEEGGSRATPTAEPAAPPPRVVHPLFAPPADTRIRVGRSLVPPDLLALLSAGIAPDGRMIEGIRRVGNVSVQHHLLDKAIEDTESLLRKTRDDLKYDGVKSSIIAELERYLPIRWGGDCRLAALAPPPEPRQTGRAGTQAAVSDELNRLILGPQAPHRIVVETQ